MFDIIEVIPYFATFLPAEQETNVLSEKDNLYTCLYAEVIFVILYRGSYLWNRIVISKI